MNDRQALFSEKRFLNPRRFWTPGSIPVWGSEIVFLSTGLDDHSSLFRYIQASRFSNIKLQLVLLFAKDNNLFVRNTLR